MSSREWQLRVQDILAAIASIQRFIASKTLEEFAVDEITVKAVLYDFMVIGEASRNIPVELQTRFPEIPWRFMNGMRNVVTHEYFQIDIERVWETIQDDLPLLVPQLQKLLEQEMSG